MNLRYFFILLFCWSLWSGNALAQKLNIKTDLSLGGNYQTGNSEKSGLSFAGQVSANDSIKEFSLNAKYNYGKDRGVKNLENYLVGIEYDYRPYSILSPFVRVELYSNEFQQIAQRYSGLFGAKYRFYTNEKDGQKVSDYSISAALVFDYEKYLSEARLDNKEKYRLSIRPKISQQLMENIIFDLVFFYQPNITDFGDYLIDGRAALNFTVNKHIFLRSSYEYKYNSRPASASVKKQDTIFLMSIGAKF